MITRDRLSEVLNYDQNTGIFTWRVSLAPRGPVGSQAGCVDKVCGRISIRIDGQLYLAHRLAWLYVYGVWPTNVLDHINRNPADNRIANLRDIKNNENLLNSLAHVDSESGIKGIRYDRGRDSWTVTITAKDKAPVRRRVKTKEEAIRVYASAVPKMHGEFAPPIDILMAGR